MIEIDVRQALKTLTRDFDVWQREQIPFATAQALNSVAKRVADAETAGLAQTFKDPTPFTMRGMTVLKARKTDLVARVIMKDTQAKYLEAYLDGGPQYLGSKRGMLTPKNVALNAYGNLTKSKLQQLKSRRDVYIGPVKTKEGMVNGVWQRLRYVPMRKRGDGPVQRLKLLIRFTDPQPVAQRLPYGQRAEAVVAQWLRPDFEAAYAQALATARPAAGR